MRLYVKSVHVCHLCRVGRVFTRHTTRVKRSRDEKDVLPPFNNKGDKYVTWRHC